MLLNLSGRGENENSKEKRGCTFYVVAIALFIISVWLLIYSGTFNVSTFEDPIRRP